MASVGWDVSVHVGVDPDVLSRRDLGDGLVGVEYRGNSSIFSLSSDSYFLRSPPSAFFSVVGGAPKDFAAAAAAVADNYPHRPIFGFFFLFFFCSEPNPLKWLPLFSPSLPFVSPFEALTWSLRTHIASSSTLHKGVKWIYCGDIDRVAIAGPGI